MPIMNRPVHRGKCLFKFGRSLGRPIGSIRQTLYRIRMRLLECIERRLAGESGDSERAERAGGEA